VVQYMRGFPHAREIKTRLMGCNTLEEYRQAAEEGRAAAHDHEARHGAGGTEDWSDDPAAFQMGSCQDC